jgi:hypothetical protein
MLKPSHELHHKNSISTLEAEMSMKIIFMATLMLIPGHCSDHVFFPRPTWRIDSKIVVAEYCTHELIC